MAGHFPWIVGLMKLLMPYSDAGKAFELIQKITLELIKSRRESGQKDKVRSIT